MSGAGSWRPPLSGSKWRRDRRGSGASARLAGDQDRVTWLSISKRSFDGAAAIELDPDSAGPAEAGEQVVDDLIDVFGSGFVGSEGDAVGPQLGRLSQGERCAVTLVETFSAEDTVNPLGTDGPEGLGDWASSAPVACLAMVNPDSEPVLRRRSRGITRTFGAVPRPATTASAGSPWDQATAAAASS